MSTCETCWADAYTRTLADPSKSQTEHYIDLLAERKDRPCPRPAETVRAWVARERSGDLWLYHNEPPEWDAGSGTWRMGPSQCVDTLEAACFPTLAPGECWPVEIRRVD